MPTRNDRRQAVTGLVFVLVLLTLPTVLHGGSQEPDSAERPTIGLALGGGAAKGFAHIGILEWFEENRIPVDYVVGTSMGGLIGGAYATGMSASDIRTSLATSIGTSSFWVRLPMSSRTFVEKRTVAKSLPRSSSASKEAFAFPAGWIPVIKWDSS